VLRLKTNGLFDDAGNNVLENIKPGDVHLCESVGRKSNDRRVLKAQCTRRGQGEIALRFYLPDEKICKLENTRRFYIKTAGGRKIRDPREAIFAEDKS